MKFRTAIAATMAICLGAAAAIAADEPQLVRQAQMKQIGASVGALAAIAKGEKPYDAAAVKTALSTIATTSKDFPNHFPAGTETGHNTAAAPAIWQNMDDFKAKSMKLAKEAETVLASMPADQAGVGAALKTIGGECSACHQAYRVKR